VYLDLEHEDFVIERAGVSVVDSRINRAPEVAPHTLFTRFDPGAQQEVEETLSVRAFFDVSVLEVFVNDRTVISTRIYPASNRCFGIRLFASADSNAPPGETLAHLKSACLWDRLVPSA
jgi:beta-fructofuranosidase